MKIKGQTFSNPQPQSHPCRLQLYSYEVTFVYLNNKIQIYETIRIKLYQLIYNFVFSKLMRWMMLETSNDETCQ